MRLARHLFAILDSVTMSRAPLAPVQAVSLAAVVIPPEWATPVLLSALAVSLFQLVKVASVGSESTQAQIFHGPRLAFLAYLDLDQGS